MFTFKQFVIKQDKTPMKVGTDGVLLGAWVKCEGKKCILDIGTGTALIALMMAQRNHLAHIDAVEIDEDSASQAKENVEASKWGDRVDIHNIDIVNFNNKFSYDLIVSNPPYFNDSLLPPSKKREVARHTTTLNFESLIDSVLRLMTCDGRFDLILPIKEMTDFKSLAKGRLFPVRECRVLSRIDGDAKRVMCEFSSQNTTDCQFENIAIRESNSNEYTQEYSLLTADFYLKF